MAQEHKPGQMPAPRFTDPFAVLRAEMEHLFDNFSFGRFPAPSMRSGMAAEGALLPHIDIHENDNSVMVECELPGIEKKDIDVTLHGGLLTVKGEKKVESREEKDDYHLMERRYGSFRRSIRVPENVDEDDVEAKFDKGVLTIRLAKKPGSTTGERKIKIKSG